jgi:hypothetical protein
MVISVSRGMPRVIAVVAPAVVKTGVLLRSNNADGF